MAYKIPQLLQSYVQLGYILFFKLALRCPDLLDGGCCNQPMGSRTKSGHLLKANIRLIHFDFPIIASKLAGIFFVSIKDNKIIFSVCLLITRSEAFKSHLI